MADKGGKNVPNRKDEFKETKNELTQKAGNEKAKIPASQYQIDQLDAARPKLTPAPAYTPQGQAANEVKKAEANRKNTEINKQQNDFRERMKQQQGKAKEAHDRANDKGR